MQTTNTVYHLISISALLRGSLAYYVVYNPSQEYLWSEAQAYCETTYGTNLATVTTQTDLDGLIQLRDSNGNSGENSWIGLNDIAVEGKMTWISGKPCELIDNLCVTYWKTGEPNNWEGNGGEDCVDIAVAGFNYAGDGPCDTYKRKQFFCDDKQYNLVNDGSTERNWPEAEAYCLATYGTHLATVPTSTDLNLLIKIRDNDGDSTEPSWIGLNDRSVEGQMQWISGAPCEINNGLCVDYWKTGEPNDWSGNGGEDCVDIAQSAFNYAGDGPCDAYKRKQFFCDVIITQYYLVYDSSGSWSWPEAQQYCQTTYGTNLATVTTQADLNELILMRNTYGDSAENSWIGLNDRIEEGKMIWISGKPCELNNNLCVTYWKTGEPNNWSGNGGEDCVDIAYADFNYAGDGPCDAYKRKQFFCDVTPGVPINEPSISPSNQPSISPSNQPSISPGNQASISPSNQPSISPGNQASISPSNQPSISPVAGQNVHGNGCVNHSFIVVISIVAAIILIS